MCACACASVVAKTYVALAADGLVAVVLGGKGLERGLNDTTTEAEDQVEGGLLWWVLVIQGFHAWSVRSSRSSRSGFLGSTNLLDVVVGQSAAILELLAGEDETLLVRRNALLVLDLALHIVDCVRGLDLKGDGLARQGLNEAVIDLRQCPVLLFIRMRMSVGIVCLRDSSDSGFVGACTYICTVKFVSISFARLRFSHR